MKNFKLFSFVLTTILCFASIAFGQERTGTIEGVVKDQQGAIVPGATVTVAGNAFNRTVTSENDGSFRVAAVPPGVYTVAVTAGNFQPESKKDVLVNLGQASNVEFDLKAGNIGAEVTITGGDVAGVDTSESKIQTNISSKQLDTLPKGTNFASSLRAAAAVRPEVTGGGFQIDGASGSENTFVLDGQEVTNFRTGTLNNNNNVPNQLVQEVQIKTNGFEAEFGGATGGVINVVTKRGANDFHGGAGLEFESSKLFARPRQILGTSTTVLRYIQPDRDSFTNTYPSVQVSGPVIKNHLYFLGSYDAQFFPQKRDFRFANGSNRVYDSDVRRDYGFARLDAQVSNKLNFSGTYLYNPISQHGVLPTHVTLDAAGSAANAPTALEQREQGGRIPATNYNFEGTYTPTSKLVLNARYGRSYLNEKITSYGVPSVVRYTCSNGRTGSCNTGFSSVGNNFATIADISIRKTFDVGASYFVNSLAGRHTFKGGYQVNRLSNDVNEGYVDTGIIDFSFAGTASDRNGVTRPTPAELTAGALGVGSLTLFGTFGKASSKNQALYFQDSWQPFNRLTLNLGFRAESEDVPSFKAGAPGIKFNWSDKIAPRLGVAYDVTGKGKWKVFASYGWFYDRFKYELPRGSFGGDIFLQYDFLITSNANIFSYTRAGILGNNFNVTDFRTVSNDPTNNRIDPNLKAFRQSEYTGGTEYQLRRDTTFSARYTHKQVDRAIEDIGYHNAGDDEEYFIGNPGFGVCAKPACGRYAVNIPGGNAAKAIRKYDALEVRLNKRLSNNYFFDGSYTYSRLFGNYAGLASSDEAQRGGGAGRNSPNVNRNFDLPFIGYTADGKPDDGRLPTDRPHLLKVNTGYSYNWFGSKTNLTEAFAFFQVGSGTPVTSRARVAFVSGQILTKRGDLGRTDVLSQTDMGIRHTYKFGNDGRYAIAFQVNVLNLFNQETELSRRETITRLNVPISTFGCANLICVDQGFFNGAVTSAKILTYANGVTGTTTNRDARYNRAQLYQDPRAIRFGFNFSF